MENAVNTPATPESVWAIIRELSLSIKASGAESDRQRKESEAKFDRALEKSSAEFDKRSVEFDKRSAEFDKRSAETDRQIRELKEKIDGMTKSNALLAETTNGISKTSSLLAETVNNISKTNGMIAETVNGISKTNGLIAEEYFSNSFKEGKQTIFGEKFDVISERTKGNVAGFEDEYDLVFFNGKSIGIIEIKNRGRLDDIPKIINKAKTFRGNFPVYQNHRIYLALASMVFHQRLEDECTKQGIAIIKQVGDVVVFNDKHLKAY